MLYQLSYSPNELNDLAAFFDGYTLGCADEADVYPKHGNVARGQRKNRSEPSSEPHLTPTRRAHARSSRRDSWRRSPRVDRLRTLRAVHQDRRCTRCSACGIRSHDPLANRARTHRESAQTHRESARLIASAESLTHPPRARSTREPGLAWVWPR